MIYYFIKPSGGGKSTTATALMKAFLENSPIVTRDSKKLFGFLEMSPKDRLKMSYKLIDEWNEKGYNFAYPEHLVWSNLTMWSKHYGEEVINYDLPGYRIGLYDKDFETWTPAPGAFIIWDEAQLQADGRDSMEMHPRVKAVGNFHRKWRMDMLIFSQRDIIDKTFRENAIIVLIDEITNKTDRKYGYIKSTTIKFKVFDHITKYEAYKTSLNSKYYKETSFTVDGCIYDHFDSYEGQEHFAECAAKQGGISLVKANNKKSTRKEIIKWVENNSYIPPEGYKKGSKK